MQIRRSLAVIVALIGIVAAPATMALAYGKADQPLAQLTFSGNCDNPSFPLCAPPPNGFGTGGIWLWVEVDTGGTTDFTGAGCGHVVGGVGGPGGAGAGPIKGSGTWWYSTGPGTAFAVGVDPGNQYYIVQIGPEQFAFPVTQGHYSWHPAPGVALEANVAP